MYLQWFIFIASWFLVSSTGSNNDLQRRCFQKTCRPMEIKSTKERQRRQLISILTQDNQPSYVSGDRSPIIVGTQESIRDMNDPNLSNVIRDNTERAIVGVTDIVMLPVQWIRHLHNNWFFYMLFVGIVLILITYMYCSCKNLLNRAMFARYLQNIPWPKESQIPKRSNVYNHPALDI